VSHSRHPVDDDALAFALLGLRFRDPVTEAEFRRWFVLDAVPFMRLAIAASAIGWLFSWLGLGVGIPHAFQPVTPWVLGGAVPLLILGYWASRHPGPLMLVGTGLVNAIGGFIAVWPISFRALDSPHLASLVLIIFAFFAFTIFRLPPIIAAPAVGSYVVLHQVLVLRAHAHHELTTPDVWIDSAIPWVAYVTGVVVCCVLSRLSREAYRRERVIEEQQRVIAAERERAELLLRNVLPDVVAEQLKNSDEPIADFFPEVTVLFADIVGFTAMAAHVPPRDLVALLNEVFSTFDALTAGRGVEKIKTIGDAYMAVAGVPEPRPDHVEAIADLALDMRGAVGGITERTGVKIQCRFGLATGPAVAGVIGQHRFAYDLWGNTVNMAARMESHGTAGRIQVTTEVCDRLRATHVFEARHPIDVKGIGMMSTWYLEARRPVDRSAQDATLLGQPADAEHHPVGDDADGAADGQQ
jgi:adenylate cyclase